jgi:hypothetical protein
VSLLDGEEVRTIRKIDEPRPRAAASASLTYKYSCCPFNST